MNGTRTSQPTLEDISHHARVSKATVSRVFCNKANVSEKTRTRVLEAARELGYGVPKNLIALILPDASNPFFAQLGFMFEQVLEAEGYHLLTSSSEGRVNRELELIEHFKNLSVKGVIYISSGGHSSAIPSLVADGTIPVVVFDRKISAGNLDFVAVDSRHGTLCAVDYLVAFGHRRIAYLKGLEGTDTAQQRFDSFCEAMTKNGLAVVDDWVFSGDYTLSAGRSCAERLIALARTLLKSERPTAIMAANDMMAVGLMQRLQQEGWRLPADLSVIGFDNILWSEWVYPALTTIAQPIHQLVKVAIKLLTARIKENHDLAPAAGAFCRAQPRREVLEPVLIPRASVVEPCDQPGMQRVVAASDGSVVN